MRRGLRNNGIAIFFAVVFLAAVGGQAIAGRAKYNQDERDHAALLKQKPQTISLGRYVTSSDYARAVSENWQSEYLQFALFILAGIWLVQRGSTESKTLDAAGTEPDREQEVGRFAEDDSPLWARVGGWRTALYSNSLLIVMFLIFIGSWLAQSVTGWTVYNEQAQQHAGGRIGWLGYIGTSDFWEATLQNWQSEFLAVGSLAVFSIYLRQRGSSQSKPVGAAHAETATEG